MVVYKEFIDPVMATAEGGMAKVVGGRESEGKRDTTEGTREATWWRNS